MSRQYKTSKNHREKYIFYSAEDTKVIIWPGKDDVTEADIEQLHAQDDADVDAQRRNDYYVPFRLDAYRNGENGDEEANDRNKYLKNDEADPETIYIEKEDTFKTEEMLCCLRGAMKSLLPQQLELFQKVYIQQRSYTDIAAEECVTEAAIRNRLKKMHEKLRKFFP